MSATLRSTPKGWTKATPSQSPFEAALAVARERHTQAPGASWTGPGRLVEAIEALARPRTVGPVAPMRGSPPRAYAFLAKLRVEAGTAVGGEPFWASEWLETRALPDAFTEIDGVAHVRDLADARVSTCATCGDPTYAVSEEYSIYSGDIVACVLTLCLRCPALAELSRALRSCWHVTNTDGPGLATDGFELVGAARSVPSNDTFACLIRRLGEDWRRPMDSQRVYALRREPGDLGLVFWPLEFCDLPVVARALARTTPGARLGTLAEIARPACARCGAPAYALGEDQGPDYGGLNYDVYDLDVCASCLHVSSRMVKGGVQYPRA